MKVLDTSVYTFQYFFLKILYKRRRLFLNCLGNLELQKKKSSTQYIIGSDYVNIIPCPIIPSAYLRMN